MSSGAVTEFYTLAVRVRKVVASCKEKAVHKMVAVRRRSGGEGWRERGS